MKRYSDIIDFNPTFKSSVNLGFDINNERKIDSFIFTADGCDLLKRYINTALPKQLKSSNTIESGYSTSLVGPYGKGKSFLILILQFLLYAKEDSELLARLVKRINAVDSELASMIIALKKEGIRLIPVILNSDYSDINQAFTIGIEEALKRENLVNVIPQTVYDVCLSICNKWKKDSFLKKKILEEAQKQGIGFDLLMRRLSEKDRGAYSSFVKIYNRVVIGLPFNPLIKENISETIETLSLQILESGFNGFFFIFDEFSKFLESNIPTMTVELKALQDIFELCERSTSKQQIHLCCIAHKEIETYSKVLGKESVSTFKTVAGRVKNIKFVRSLGENYYLIASAIEKNKEYKEVSDKYISTNKSFYDWFVEKEIVSSQQKDVLFRECFPLNPFAVCALIALSEKIAQNERTLFTCLSDFDYSSFRSFVHGTGKGLYNVPNIYDYFNSLFPKCKENQISSIWYRCASILPNVQSEAERNYLKTMCIFEMLQEDTRFDLSTEYICKAAGLSESKALGIEEALIQGNFIRRNGVNNKISFASRNSKDIDNAVNKYLSTHGFNISISELLFKVNKTRYLVPREYNSRNKITRYAENIFLSFDEIRKIADLNLLSQYGNPDGLVINMFCSEGFSEDAFKQFYMDTATSKNYSIIRIPTRPLSKEFIRLVREAFVLVELSADTKYDESMRNEMQLIARELQADINNEINEIWEESSSLYWNGQQYTCSCSKCLSIMMSQLYPLMPIVNNELVNKHSVSAQYSKARNNVVDKILITPQEASLELEGFSSTSPEMTVFNSIFRSNGKESVYRVISDMQKDLVTEKSSSFVDFVCKYSNSPYGIREGIFPVLLAEAIRSLPGYLLITSNNQEREMNANLMASIVSKPIDFKRVLVIGGVDYDSHVKKLIEVFGGTSCGYFWKDVQIATDLQKRFCSGLPGLIRSNSLLSDSEKLPKGTGKYISEYLKYNINSFNVIFNRIPLLLNCSGDLGKTLDTIIEIRKSINEIPDLIAEELSAEVKDLLGGEPSDSLAALWQNWKSANNEKLSSINDAKLKKFISDMDLHGDFISDSMFVNILSKALVGEYIIDWSEHKSDEIVTIFSDCVNSSPCVKESNAEFDSFESIYQKYSAFEETDLGMMMQSGISDVFEEWRESVSREEKIRILLEFVKELL